MITNIGRSVWISDFWFFFISCWYFIKQKQNSQHIWTTVSKVENSWCTQFYWYFLLGSDLFGTLKDHHWPNRQLIKGFSSLSAAFGFGLLKKLLVDFNGSKLAQNMKCTDFQVTTDQKVPKSCALSAAGKQLNFNIFPWCRRLNAVLRKLCIL